MSRLLSFVAAVSLSASLASEACAHDLKVLVSRLVAEPGDTDTVYISYGHVLPVDRQIDATTLDDYQVHTPSGSVVYLAKEGVSFQANELHVEENGVYQAMAARRPSVWCDVVDDKGNHTHHRGPRSSVAEGTVESATQTHMYAKALLLSGEADEQALIPLGHDIEIVPVQPPSEWRAGRDLPFQVLFQGKPLRSADLVATYIGFKPENAWCYATSTDSQGTATLRAERPGTWVLRVRTQRPADVDHRDEYDHDTYTATLVLEIRP